MTRKKTKKFRGSMTHGRGKKGGRGAGLRGGRGHAGFTKHKVMHMNKYHPEHYLGRYGFKRPQKTISDDICINVGKLEEAFPGKKEIDLEKEGISKLLGGGKVSTKLTIKVKKASSKAVKKIQALEGQINLIE